MSHGWVDVEVSIHFPFRSVRAGILQTTDESGRARPADKLNDGYPASACVLNPARRGGEGRS
ncbi:Hypothetical protein PFCIRM514_10540 [Propionibacterium freudenreichii]|nr:Hypothetical protein PFCIRM514_10540 [Propionibacterium freudenreichii]